MTDRIPLDALNSNQYDALHERLEAAEAKVDQTAILRIVLDYVVESNDSGGLDANDLSWRLEQAGYPLPDDES